MRKYRSFAKVWVTGDIDLFCPSKSRDDVQPKSCIPNLEYTPLTPLPVRRRRKAALDTPTGRRQG
jgi:hypothetical protein